MTEFTHTDLQLLTELLREFEATVPGTRHRLTFEASGDRFLLGYHVTPWDGTSVRSRVLPIRTDIAPNLRARHDTVLTHFTQEALPHG